jgi:hypothetical protein
LMIDRVRSTAMTSTFSLLQRTISGRRRVRFSKPQRTGRPIRKPR